MSPDPTVINAIVQAARRYGADPGAMLATALVESGANWHTVGDNGTSFGVFQHHIGGALGNHPASWAESPAGVQERAQEFARLGIRSGKGAAALQRPADPSGYAVKVDSSLSQARRLLAGAGVAPGAPAPRAPRLGTPGQAPGITTPAPNNQMALQAQQTQDLHTQVLQSLMDANSHLAGIQSTPMPHVTAPEVDQALMNPATAVPVSKSGFATPTQAGPPGQYVNPLKGFKFAGTDMGTDWSGSGAIGAVGNAVITRVSAQNTGTGWPGAGDASHGNKGAMITYRLLDGPHKGKFVYLAENVDPLVKVGQIVGAGAPVAHARGTFPYLETGWASNAHGTTLASSQGSGPDHGSAAGASFLAFLKQLGVSA